jgi:hypothetical protein
MLACPVMTERTSTLIATIIIISITIITTIIIIITIFTVAITTGSHFLQDARLSGDDGEDFDPELDSNATHTP